MRHAHAYPALKQASSPWRAAIPAPKNYRTTSPELKELLALSTRLHRQKRTDKHKLYSLHEPAVDCRKGKAHKRYEFGCKVALAVARQGGWVLAAKVVPGNPYEGPTLKATLEQASDLTGKDLDWVYVDLGYSGHDYEGPVIVNVDKRLRGKTPKCGRWMKRRLTIEPAIGHLKEHKRLELQPPERRAR